MTSFRYRFNIYIWLRKFVSILRTFLSRFFNIFKWIKSFHLMGICLAFLIFFWSLLVLIFRHCSRLRTLHITWSIIYLARTSHALSYICWRFIEINCYWEKTNFVIDDLLNLQLFFTNITFIIWLDNQHRILDVSFKRLDAGNSIVRIFIWRIKEHLTSLANTSSNFAVTLTLYNFWTLNGQCKWWSNSWYVRIVGQLAT